MPKATPKEKLIALLNGLSWKEGGSFSAVQTEFKGDIGRLRIEAGNHLRAGLIFEPLNSSTYRIGFGRKDAENLLNEGVVFGEAFPGGNATPPKDRAR